MIRAFQASDAKAVEALELETLHTTLGCEMLVNSLNNPLSHIYIYELEKKLAGYISTSFDGIQLEILNFCVTASHQSKGIGKELLGFTINQFLDKGLDNVILEVRKSNQRAIHVYEKFGFQNLIERKNYYSDGENAIVMQKKIIQPDVVEDEFQSCYSARTETKKYISYEDIKNPERYYSNYYLLKQNDEEVITKLYQEAKGFLQFNLNEPYTGKLKFSDKEQHGIYYSSIYALKLLKDSLWNVECLTEENSYLLEALLYTDAKKYGDGYAIANSKRQIEVALEQKTTWYMATSDGMPVGAMNVFVYKNVAKIEDVFVIEEYRHHGICQAMFQKAIMNLKKQGVTEVELVADLEDTPKDMYEKMGFVLVDKKFIVREVF